MWRKIHNHPTVALLVLALPGLICMILFKYVPLFGNVIVFQNYDMFKGIAGSRWVGLAHFHELLLYPDFLKILRNTVIVHLYSIVFGFPAPLLLSLLLNEIRQMWFKRPVQTFLYLPHFLSWVIVGGIFLNLLSTDGVANQILAWFGIKPSDFITEPAYFRSLIVSIGIWKEVGWGMIVYLAAIAGINPNLYEAATVDGASRWRQMWHITLPGLLPAIVVLFLLRIGHMLDSNVEQMLVFLNPLVRDVGEVIDTYVYRAGLLNGQFSYTTAIGVFKSVVGLTLILGLNRLSRKLTGESIY
jgi:putative aldouronate transport system permease protein